VLIGINAQKLFVTNDYRNAGISRYISGICRRLPALPGPERYVLYTNEAVKTWPGVEGERLRIVSTPMPTTNPLLRIVWEQTVLPVLARRHNVDLLHCPLNVRPIASTPPVVLTIHDLTFERFPDRFNPLKQRYLSWLTRHSAHRARRVLADSAATKEDVERYYGISPSRVDVVYPGVDDDFRPYQARDAADAAALAQFRARHHLPERIILYLGTLEPRKNVDRLVHAYSRLVAQGLPHHLVLAGGKGWHYQAIFQAVEDLGLRERVHFPGYVSREEQPLWYNAADVFVYPSLYEGFGIPPLEAMACGVPVVTSDTSSLPEAVGDAGTTVDPTDVEALTEAIGRVLNDPSRAASLRGAGRRRAALFTWEAAAERCLASYRRSATAAHVEARVG
jgi:glycosyltransferase involved in cell wall biosynthesis